MTDTTNKLKALYLECFSDSKECVDYLFNSRLGTHNALYEIANDKIACAAYLVKKSLSYGSNNVEIPFIVGLSTAKEYRKQGYAKRLITKALTEMNAPFVMLYPEVKNFYQRMDFQVISQDDTINVDDYKKEKTCQSEELLNLYQKKCQGNDFYIRMEKKDFIDKLNITHADGGNFYLLKKDGVFSGYTNGEETLCINTANKQNGVMARIVNLKNAFLLTKNTIPIKIKLTDSLFENNNYCFTVNNGEIIKQNNFDLEISVAELTAHFFGFQGKLKDFFKNTKGFISERY